MIYFINKENLNTTYNFKYLNKMNIQKINDDNNLRTE
jgi:hypothetical protein